MKRIGIILLSTAAIAIVLGAILLPPSKGLVMDVQGMVRAVTFLLIGYVLAQAGLLFFVAGILEQRIALLETTSQTMET